MDVLIGITIDDDGRVVMAPVNGGGGGVGDALVGAVLVVDESAVAGRGAP